MIQRNSSFCGQLFLPSRAYDETATEGRRDLLESRSSFRAFDGHSLSFLFQRRPPMNNF